jgi:hypothetical protein
VLHEIRKKRCFLVVAVCHFTELRLFRLTLIRLRIQQDACFLQLAKLFFNVQQNALFNVAFRCCLLLCRSLQFCDPVLLVSPIEGLPLKGEPDCAGALRRKLTFWNPR